MSRSNMSFLKKSNLDISPLEVQEENDTLGVESFLKIINERFEKFGIGKHLKTEVELKIKIINLRCKYIKSGDRFLLNTIRVFEGQLEELNVNVPENEYNFEDDLGVIIEYFKTPINPKKITLYEFDVLKKRIGNG